MRNTFLILSLLLSLTSFSQETATLQGRVLDRQKPLARATITIKKINDSIPVKTVLARNDGRFTVTGLPLNDSLLVQISFTGYQGFSGLLVLRQKHFMMQPVQLSPASKTEEGLIIKVERPLMVIKPDTVEFRADAFKTPPNAQAEDLIKRIPGLSLDQNGKLYFNGRPVTSILVDGKPFFGTDGTLALKNIPADMIDKIQFSDTKSPDEIALSTPAKNEDATLNIKLKSGNKYFGRLGAAAGTDGRYSSSAFLAADRGKDRINLVGNLNNINSMDKDITVLTQGGGITRTLSTGLDYSHQLNDKDYLNASYRFIQPVTYRENVLSSQQEILPNQFLKTDAASGYVNRNTEHDITATATRREGLGFSFEYDHQSIDNTSQTSQNRSDQNAKLLNSLSSRYESTGLNTKLTGTLSYVKLFNQKGRLLAAAFRFSTNNQSTNDFNLSTVNYYRNNNLDSVEHVRQQILQSDRVRATGFNIAYFNPLGRYTRISLTGDLSAQWSHATKTTWNLDSGNKQLNIDSLYSNDFKSTLLATAATTALQFELHKRRLNFQLGEGIFSQDWQNLDLTKGSILHYHWLNFSPEGFFNYSFSNAERITLKASNNYILPATQQLQPVADNSNPIFIRLGNPDLKPANNYNLMLRYAKELPAVHNLSYGGQVQFNPVMDKITEAVRFDTSGKELQQYVNVNGTYTFSSSLNGSIHFKKGPNSFLITFLGSYVQAKDKQYLNGSPVTLYQNTFSPNLAFLYTKADRITASLNYFFNRNQLRYSQSNIHGNGYTTQHLNGNLDLYLFRRIRYRNSLIYQYNSGIPANLERSSLLWNMNASVFCLKNKNGEIRFTAFDLLHQNRNLSRTITATTITDSQSNNLQQYFLIGFSYHFGKLEKRL